jgi:hypothetical protein
VIVEPERACRGPTASAQHENAGEVEALFDQPPLRLPLDRVACRLGPVSDEEHFPLMAQHHFVDAPDGAFVNRLQRRPEVRSRHDRLPDHITTAPQFTG